MSSNENQNQVSEALDIDAELKERPRSPTLLNLSWLRDRINKKEEIQKKLASGQYRTDSQSLAKAIIDKE